MSEEKEFFSKDFAFVAQTSTEDVPVEENFDWNDERRKKYEERQEKHAQYFSPLSAICEFIAESNEVEERKARDDAQKEWIKTMKRERKIISEKKEKERQEKIQMDEIKAYYQSSKVVDLVKERLRNQETIESFQEEIIEREEDVPAFKNMPKENYIKTEKTRRIEKEPITGQTTVHCPFCNNKRRTLKELNKHMHQIHSREIRDKADEQSQTKKDDIKEIKVNFQEKKIPQIDIVTKLEDDENWHIYLKFSDVQKVKPDHNQKPISESKEENIINVEKKEVDVDMINHLTDILSRGVKGRVNEIPLTKNEEMGGKILTQQEEHVPQPANIAPTPTEQLDKLSHVGNNEIGGQILVQKEMLSQSTNVVPELVNSHQQEEKELVHQNLNCEVFNEYSNRNIGRRGWLRNMVSKVNFILYLYDIHLTLCIFFQVTQRLRMIKGGVSKKNHRRRTVDSLSVTSPASSNVFLLRLKNNGNFCYSNAAVTCILGNPLIKQFILEENGTPGGPLSQLKTLLGTQIDQVHICFFGGYKGDL